MEVAGASWFMRDAASRRIVAVSAAISAQRRLTPADLETIAASGSVLMAA